MSRSQQNTTFNTSQSENQGYNANANSSYNAAQADEGNYESELGKYSSENPYGEGGEYQTATNQQLSNTADAQAQAAGQAIQSAAVRTGSNPAGAIAATEAMNEQNTRNLSSAEASATQQRIGDEAGYNQNILNASQQPASFEAELSGQQGQLAQGALGTQEQAAQTPSFMDELGNGLIGAGVGYAASQGKGH